jgi:hypothetical protein
MLLGLTAVVGVPPQAQDTCPVDAAQAVEAAQHILDDGDPTKFRVALSCLTLALAQTRAELEGLRDGRLAFTGQAYVPKGFVMSRPSVQEDR